MSIKRVALTQLTAAQQQLAKTLDDNPLIKRADKKERSDGALSAEELGAALEMRDQFRPEEQKVLDELASLMGLGGDKAPAPAADHSRGSLERPEGTHNPALARFADVPAKGAGAGGKPGEVKDTKGVDDAPPAELSTKALGGAFVSARDYVDTTGPTGKVLGRRKSGSVRMFATPGAKLRLYNTNVLDGGKPQLLVSHDVPSDLQNPIDRMKNMVPWQREQFKREHKDELAMAEQGFVAVDVKLPQGDDWEVGDTLRLTQQVGTREESEALSIPIIGANHRREPYVREEALCVRDDRVASTEDLTVPPHTMVQLARNGVRVGEPVVTDDSGQFSLAIPGSDRDGAWSLVAWSHQSVDDAKRFQNPKGRSSTSSGSGPTTEVALGRILGSGEGTVSSWESQIMDALLQPPRDHQVAFTLEGLPPGFKLTAKNPAGDPMQNTFTADDNGRLEVCLDQVAVGDGITLSSDELTLSGGRRKKLDAHYVLPDQDSAERIAFVRETLDFPKEGYESEVLFALELFGPGAQIPEVSDLCDPAKMKAIHDGARKGFYFKNMRETVLPHMIKHGAGPHEIVGFNIGGQMDGKVGVGTKEEFSVDLVKRGQTNMVITGGYSPISGSHGPLTPEYVQGPSQYRIHIDGYPDLDLKTPGGQPRGWVNPNAYGLVFGVNLNNNDRTFNWVPPGGGPV